MNRWVQAVAVIGVGTLFVGCGGAPGDEVDTASLEATISGTAYADSRGHFVVYANPYGDGRSNPTAGIEGRVRAFRTATGGTSVLFETERLPKSREFGAHAHKLACSDNKAGGHYQNVPSPTTPTDPAYANPQNEVWLDFKTDQRGRGYSLATVAWQFRPGEAKAVVIHDRRTDPANGTAGAKLACINIAF